MIEVTAKRDANGICSITAQGHSGFAESGSDIICASVSSLIQALSVGLEDVLELQDVRIIRSPEIPVMGFEWNSRLREAQYIALTIAGSLRAV
ncbi:MAG: ribosomal-processing cysteine protease Prp, partial [Synergistaceae bacterium]|nr:ribosomal-processing cysteine protease Prp [Synergistaceae bacterium]